jgi:hypothetical protein
MQPQSISTTCGGTATFSVIPASGYHDLVYQWRKNGVALPDGPTAHGSVIAGATGAMLAITNAQSVDAGTYEVVISNACGQATSNPVVLAVTPCGNTPGDVNGDGDVDVDDLLAVITGWGVCPVPPPPCLPDIAPPPSGNGVVNVDDLLMVIVNWG